MRIGSPIAALAVLGALLAITPGARAQTPDFRAIRPVVMLLVDTSGSMEYRTDYVQTGTSIGCAAPGACPDCSGGAGTVPRSRWSTVLEAMTGSWPTYSCTMQGSLTAGRNTPFFNGQYDYLYPIPYFQHPSTAQNLDGVLDAYVDRVKFGLMTFDGAGTLVPSAIPDASGLVDSATFTTAPFLARSNGWEGMYSYGLNRPVLFPGCPDTKMINNGARSQLAPAGGLISVGTDAQDYRAINQAIQTSLLATRSYGGTPIAGMLDDLRQYFQTNTDVTAATGSGGDPYYSCRQRYALLLTDGYPDSDFRGAPFYCESAGGTAASTCYNAAHVAVPCQCPYDLDTNIAADLCHLNPSGQCDGTGKIKGLFVVGLAIDPTTHATAAHLDTLASMGGTQHAYLGTDLASLRAALAAVLDTAASTVNTRTAPAFANTGSTATTGQAQYQFNTGFVVGSTVTTSGTPVTTPWSGVLERHRYVCDATLTPVAQPLDDGQGDRFQTVLNGRSAARTLYTVLPSSPANAGGWLTGVSTSTPLVGALPFTPAESNLGLVPFTRANPALTAAYFGGSVTAARRDAIIDYVQGVAPAERALAKLGDIYHSSPVVVSAPPQDVSDESFNYFRQRDEVKTRPTVLYVGTNDGILHAFATGAWTYASGPHAGTSIGAGDELWGFVPPAILSKLDAAASGHQLTVDGTPVVREVFYRKTPGGVADGNSYHTVLVVGLRGSNAYEAIDVTDPLSPTFLWQYGDANMGLTYGQPGLGQVLLRTSGGDLEERSVAVLPGGTGSINLVAAAAAGVAGCPAAGAGAAPATTGTSASRANLRCWSTKGREVTVMDTATGEVLAQFDSTRANAPMTGSVSLYTGDTGTIATRAYMTDQDGVMWRLDMGSPSIGSWVLQPFHDIFWDGTATTGQPAYNPPILSVDTTGKVVILQGTGDIDALDSTGANRVVSLTETQTCPTPATCTWSAGVNWEVRLHDSEQVTGPMELYNGVVYFGSFQSIVDPLNACSLGTSRVWGVKYLETEAPSGSQPTPTGKSAMETAPGSGSFVQFITPPTPLDTVPVMGVGVTQQPTCFEGSTSTDPYFGGSRYQVTNTGGGQFTLVAQFSGVQAATGVSVMTRQLPAPASYSSISAWTGSTD